MLAPFVRPAGGAEPGLAAHLHAAVLPFHALAQGRADLGQTVGALFEDTCPVSLLHLIPDDREIAGAGESQFVRGILWISPLRPGSASESCAVPR